jgi:hypothetical protein
MNGRLYDYQAGRFLGVDPVLQFPTNSQSLNPYSYILNNPLGATDPTGYAIEGLPLPGRTTPIDQCRTGPFSIGCGGYTGRELYPGRSNGSNHSQSSHGGGSRGENSAPASEKGSISNTPTDDEILARIDHYAYDSHGNLVNAAIPIAAREGLLDALRSRVGRRILSYLTTTNTVLRIDESEFNEFHFSPEENAIKYPTDFERFIADSPRIPGDELDSLTYGSAFIHEIGHTPAGRAAFGLQEIEIQYIRTISEPDPSNLPPGATGTLLPTVTFTLDQNAAFQEEYRAVMILENPYRFEKGLPLRWSYFNENDILEQAKADLKSILPGTE